MLIDFQCSDDDARTVNRRKCFVMRNGVNKKKGKFNVKRENVSNKRKRILKVGVRREHVAFVVNFVQV